jgi:thiamine pyrophosphate-dependent acetolactate synthase large subunit-like protein
VIVAEAVGRALAEAGVGQVFGVVGSGNFHVTNALVAAGARFVAARHENGAATMADAYARTSATVTALSVHQGCGLTNAMTGITEAAKSRTPLLVLAAEATSRQSNFFVDQERLVEAVGAVARRVTSADEAVAVAVEAYRTAQGERRTVVLNLPLDVQAAVVGSSPGAAGDARPGADSSVTAPSDAQPPAPDAAAVDQLVEALVAARRPVFVAGRGARGPGGRHALEDLAERTGALLATSAVAHGLFRANPWSLGISGGFATPLAAELIHGADLVVGWGCALNMWTTAHGRLIAPGATLVQVDVEPEAIGRNRPVSVGVVGDVATTADAAARRIGRRADVGYRSAHVAQRIASEGRWRDVPIDDTSSRERIDPRVLSRALDEALPRERVVAVDSGNFMGYPSAYLAVPDERGFCLTQAFQSVGLGLATAIGLALAQPARLAVAALGDGGALMGASELETVVRLGLPMVVVVYNDAAYGAEVHHFGPHGDDLSAVVFPDTDFASLARGIGFEATTVRTVGDLDGLRGWLAGERRRPFLVDAKVVADRPSWWLEDAFRGH